ETHRLRRRGQTRQAGRSLTASRDQQMQLDATMPGYLKWHRLICGPGWRDYPAMQNGTREAIRQQMTALPGWYHDIDLGQGLVTPGRGLAELWNMNRRLMDLVDFRDKAVLDIGAMDGMWSFEAERRGAALVIATDAYQWGHRRFIFCKEVLGSHAVPYFDVSVYQLAEALDRVSAPARKFDVVICFGVLYHLRDPMLALTQIRSVLKDGGVALFETAYFHSRDPVMHFNTGGKLFYDDVTTWWAPSYP